MKKLVATSVIAMFAAAPAFSGGMDKQQMESSQSGQEVQRMEEGHKAQKMEESSQSAQAQQSLSDRDAKKVQAELAEKGFYEGNIDGKIGPKTQEGITKFQENNDLTASGELNQETVEALGIDVNLMQAQEEEPKQHDQQKQQEKQHEEQKQQEQIDQPVIEDQQQPEATQEGEVEQRQQDVQEQEDFTRPEEGQSSEIQEQESEY